MTNNGRQTHGASDRERIVSLDTAAASLELKQKENTLITIAQLHAEATKAIAPRDFRQYFDLLRLLLQTSRNILTLYARAYYETFFRKRATLETEEDKIVVN